MWVLRLDRSFLGVVGSEGPRRETEVAAEFWPASRKHGRPLPYLLAPRLALQA